MKECDVQELYLVWRQTPRTGALIDVREYAEFAGGRVAGATLIPLGELVARHSEIDRNQTVYLLCRTGRRSAEAQCRLQALGFTDVRNVTGGFEAWRSAGLPIERDAHAVWSLERQVRFTAGMLVLLGIALSFAVHPIGLVLSGFVAAGLVFAAVTDTCGMALLLARLPWNRRNPVSCGVEAVS